MAEGGVRRAIEDAADEISAPGGLVRTFIRHPNAANLLMTLMILIGVFSILKINTQFFPSVDRPQINISITWSGASAEDVETNVLAVVEPEVRLSRVSTRWAPQPGKGRDRSGSSSKMAPTCKRPCRTSETAVKGITTLPDDSVNAHRLEGDVL